MLRHGGEDDGELVRVPVAAPGHRPGQATEDAWVLFHERIHAFVSRRVSGPDAEDIVQRVFLQMHRTIDGIQHEDRVGAWLYQAARNAIADHYRAPARRREVLAGGAAELDREATAGAEDEEREAAACLRPMLGRLTETDRRALELVELEGLSQAQAASAAGISLSGMKSRVQRARRRLKQTLHDCCRFHLDGRGGVLGCEKRDAGTACHTGPGRTEC